MENSNFGDYNLMCNENRGFIYDEGVNPDFIYQRQLTPNEDCNMANNLDENTPSTRVVPSVANQQLDNTPKRKRKRDSLKDKKRTEAEQSAFKKLKELIPALRGRKRITKLQTITEACLYIEHLQKALTGIRKG